jgi:hypothetical protein
MSVLTARPTPAPTAPPVGRTLARWMVSFLGFPLGGLAALTLFGPVDNPASALAGGLVTGIVLGGFQAWALHASRRGAVGWVLATAIGLAVGLTTGSWLVGYATGLRDLAIQGAVTGAVVGLAQAVALWRRGGAVVLLWPVYLAAVWAAGWTVTTLVGVRVDDQFTVFGAAGAVTATLLTGVLPVRLAARPAPTSTSVR